MTNEERHAGINPDPNQFAEAKKRLASHPDAHPDTLDKLSEQSDSEVAERVAENPRTQAQTLEKLSQHESPEVRSAVTENTNTPDSVIESLAEDEHPDVRFRLAENPHAPVDVLENLTEDENPYVAAKAQDTLDSLKSLLQQADEHLLKEQFVEAEESYKQLVSGLETMLGGQHMEVAQALHKLAAAVGGQGRKDEAATLEERAQVIQAAQEQSS
jgi:hypothetical protein